MFRLGACELKLTSETEKDGLSHVEGAQHIGVRRVILSKHGDFIGSDCGPNSPSETNLLILNPLLANFHVIARPHTIGTVEMMDLSDSKGVWLNRVKMAPGTWYTVGSGAELRLGQTAIRDGVVYYAPKFRIHVQPSDLPDEFAG